MAHPLDGAHFKIIWANQHFDALKKMCLDYENADLHRFIAQAHNDFVLVDPLPMPQPFLDIGGHIGDCLTNCMAVFDYIIWHLAGKHAGRPLAPPQSGLPKPAKGGWDVPSFPLYIDRDDFIAYAGLNRYNFPTDVKAMIESVQPYNAGYEPLGLLYRLVNQDKHRERIHAVGKIESGEVVIVHPSGAIERPLASSAQRVVFKAPYEPNTPPSERKVEVKAQYTVRVTWADPAMPREPVYVTLNNVLGCVNDIFGRFHQFF